uniref:NADH dehydrogenase subunit 2 n=1 Tax=Ulva meridionalis TaxID=434723 RepID=UPI002114F9CB|nr:NADH dehydrogenase subunit 2 [Ulva meridionalis]UTA96502.1 NADH dehydrogenase subunit 2 [Ulva meridionalis]UTA96562.1 NADH dehydrogenase subunit 2 [Ulva meridionalis]UTA96619.1 NADH dehydrogenase subunit 2 [Ulva meridionalis]UTA96671.1 NADH dehydrogenase subunit 2 [Ulva meridionalis]UTA96724.1 NADH dehydrogenase subunit 2 [Ulva meridionalis]
MHTIDFLVVIPECFQIILINILLLFAICFSNYNTQNLTRDKLTHSTYRPFERFVNLPTLSKRNARTFAFALAKAREKDLDNGFENTLDKDRLSLKTESGQLIQQNQLSINNYNNIEYSAQLIKTQMNTIRPSYAYISTPVTLIEPIIQLIILSLICSKILYINCPLTYAIGLTDSIIWDSLSRFMSVLLCVSASASLLLGLAAVKRYGRYEFVFIIWLSIIGMLCLLKSYNFLTFYLSIELQSLSFYMLAAMRSKTEASAEAGLKYFILSAFSSAILLLGITLIYAAIGSQNFADLSIIINYFYSVFDINTAIGPESLENPIPVSLGIGLACICISLLFKLAAAPFHLWVADVYEGSPTAITAFFAITAKIAAASALIRILELHITIFELLPLIAILSLVVGSFSAMRQVKLKRLIAFSGVANVGWFLLALITGQWDLLIVHLVVYILLSICLFSIFVLPLFRTHPNLEYRQRIKQNNSEHMIDHGTDSLTIKYISDLNQLNKTNPSLALAMVIALFSLAGIPPFAGFYSKYLIINALTQTEQYLTLSIALACAILSAFYYIRVIKTIYFTNTGVSFNPNLLTLLPFKETLKYSVQQIHNQFSRAFVKQNKYSVLPVQAKIPKKGFAGQNNIGPNQHKFKMFTIMPISANAYICALSTIITVLFFVKPNYIFVCIALSQ